MNGLGPRVLVCDHHDERADAVLQLVERCGAQPCRITADLPDREIRRLSAAVILLSVGSGVGASLDVLVRRWLAQGPDIICYADDLPLWPLGDRCRLLLAGARSVLDTQSPAFQSELRRALHRMLGAQAKQNEEADELWRFMRQLGVVGQSEGLLAAYRWARKAALTSDLPVLITGETGTGKESLARAVHHLDPKRSRHPFVAVNCSTISSTLAESELFGHQKGSYTGGDWQREGFFRAADGGVIFLDEIGELDLSLQAKLLRVLQERAVRGLGQDQEVAVDVRVVAATNRPLASMVEQETFRVDLYHRLNVLSIQLPPLRDRREDIESLVQHFLSKHNDAGQTLTPASEFIESLRRLGLPGNIRQLENLMRWVIANKEDDGPLVLSDLPPHIWEELSVEAADAGQLDTTTAGNLESQLQALLATHNWNLSQSLAYCERLMLTSALRKSRGNQSQAASLMGITPRTVRNKLRRFDISSSQ